MEVSLKNKAPKSGIAKAATEPELRLKVRKLADRWAKRVVGGGGFAIIASILAILIFICAEVLPLFQSAHVKVANTFKISDLIAVGPAMSSQPVAVGMDENQEIGYLVLETGLVQFFSLRDGRPREHFRIEGLRNECITAVSQSLRGTEVAFGTSRGRAGSVSIDFGTGFVAGVRRYQPRILQHAIYSLDREGHRVERLSVAGKTGESLAIAALGADKRVRLYMRQQEESLFGDVQIDSANYALDARLIERPVTIALNEDQRNLYVGSEDGKLYHWQVSLQHAPELVSVAKATQRRDVAVTALSFLIGDRTLLVGDSRGQVSAWFLVRDSTATSGWRLTRIHQMQSHSTAVAQFAPSPRRKGFISCDRQGSLFLHYATSERLLARFGQPGNAEVGFVNFAPKANGTLVLGADGYLTHWRIDNPHPEASFRAFFGKVWYEGYDRPEYVWQSTGGSDNFEPKLSLVPLIFGSFKGTFYALLIAIPLAILAALYTSQFMHPTLRSYVKPSVEVMAALPSVVLGFLAGLWLAPRMEGIAPALLLMAVVLPTLILLASLLWRTVPRAVKGRLHAGSEALLLVPVVALGVWICLGLNETLEQSLFAGDFRSWLFATFDLSYDQRNALVVGIAMGFAVIPIIYTVSEDALSNVPRYLTSGSLALGATRWQTAVRVVLPTAASGIFSAVMIGFGRAVGETMIVLMATGNTPIMDWNIFNGFRTLSANIAVEIPEAPDGGTLYRVLFLAALLLFVITFLVNTLAELVRQRMRAKYQRM